MMITVGILSKIAFLIEESEKDSLMRALSLRILCNVSAQQSSHETLMHTLKIHYLVLFNL